MLRRASPAIWGRPASSMVMGLMVASQARRRAASAVMGPASRSMRPSPVRSAGLRVMSRWGRSPPCDGRSEESRWRRQISVRASARRCAGVRRVAGFEGGRFGEGADGGEDDLAGFGVQVAVDADGSVPGGGDVEPAGEEGCFGVEPGSVGVGEAAPVGEGLGNTRAGRVRAWATSSGSSRRNRSGASARASTSSRTRHSDKSPAANACRVWSMCWRARATLTRLRHTAGGSPVAAISQAVGEAKPCAWGTPRRWARAITAASRASA